MSILIYEIQFKNLVQLYEIVEKNYLEVSCCSLATLRRFNSSARLMLTALVGVVELNPPSVNVTVLFVVKDAESS